MQKACTTSQHTQTHTHHLTTASLVVIKTITQHLLDFAAPQEKCKSTPSRGRWPNPTTCLIPGPVRPTMPNRIRSRSAVFPQCTGQTERPTDRSFAGKFDDYIFRCAPRATRPNNTEMILCILRCCTRPAVHTGIR